MAERVCKMKTLRTVDITPNGAEVNGIAISSERIVGLYRQFVGNYPKFFKMDSLCKLGIIAAELLLRDIPVEEKENAAIVLFNRNSSLITDRIYQKTIMDGNYFPSPALFVYTLANIVTGEIAIRHKIYGETSFYVLDHKDEYVIKEMVNSLWVTTNPSMVISGWVDYNDEDDYLAELRLTTK